MFSSLTIILGWLGLGEAFTKVGSDRAETLSVMYKHSGGSLEPEIGGENLRNQFLFNAQTTAGKNSASSLVRVASKDEGKEKGTQSQERVATYPVDRWYLDETGNSKVSNNETSFNYELRSLRHGDESYEDPFKTEGDNPFHEEEARGYQVYVPEHQERSWEPSWAASGPSGPSGLSGLTGEEEKIRRNERARLKQLRRKPRFHYTKLPYVTIFFTLIQIIVFIVELAKMSSLTGSAFQTKPYFNPMLGPSTYLMINMGARYAPCMHQIKNVTDDLTILFPCANSTSTDTNVCTLDELCGLSGLPVKDDVYEPHQWYRVIVPIFLHAGFIHIMFNLALQTTMGAVIERSIGCIKFFIIYMMSGISGFILGANFSPDGIASTGASGALFGILATNLVLFFYCGKKNTNLYGTRKYCLFLFIMSTEIVVSLVLGLLPGLDNFSHIGGFAMGLLMAVVLLPDPFFIYTDSIITYNAHDNTMQQFINNWNPMHNLEDKILPRFYCWCATRVVCLTLAILYIAMLVKNFYASDSEDSNCSWCKYINCIPVHGWCDIGTVTIESTSSSSSSSSASSTDTSSTTTDDLSDSNIKRMFPSKEDLPDANSFTFQQRGIQASHQQQNFEDTKFSLAFYVLIGLIVWRYVKLKRLT